MTKVETIVEEIEHCGECLYALDTLAGKGGFRCGKTKRPRIIKDLWGEISDFCPLPNKEK